MFCLHLNYLLFLPVRLLPILVVVFMNEAGVKKMVHS